VVNAKSGRWVVAACPLSASPFPEGFKGSRKLRDGKAVLLYGRVWRPDAVRHDNEQLGVSVKVFAMSEDVTKVRPAAGPARKDVARAEEVTL
jgi:hypothetical protein